ncbi:hypothetical protein OG369_39830 [Streptomyces sp. NBC_01221]|uniref:hypothetical protein n=1 Tax=Streptomyces sp. NBC_01221 TaxID=2903782 RepID=UPI00224F787E|nr:hypothetical protein [Streptomyces sp. NBC_01221]MCX4792001.1 hypothetical protein [Streptomyces sp. NBC_01221]
MSSSSPKAASTWVRAMLPEQATRSLAAGGDVVAAHIMPELAQVAAVVLEQPLGLLLDGGEFPSPLGAGARAERESEIPLTGGRRVLKRGRGRGPDGAGVPASGSSLKT